MYYLGKSHQQYDHLKTDLDAFRNLHSTFILLCYCYPHWCQLQPDKIQKCRDFSFVYAQVEGLHLGIQDRRARIRGRGGSGCVGANAGASAGNSSGTTIGGWSPALPFFPGKKTDETRRSSGSSMCVGWPGCSMAADLDMDQLRMNTGNEIQQIQMVQNNTKTFSTARNF